MPIFDQAEPIQVVQVAPNRTFVWLGRRYWPGEQFPMQTAEAENYAAAGFLIPPPAPDAE